MKAVILAAGEGTRLRPLTLQTPKPLILIQGKPVIERILEVLPDEIDEVVMVIEHLKEKIKSHLGDNFHNKKITYVDQGLQRGTYGALLSCKALLQKGERFLVLNGDDMHSKEELRQFMNHQRAFGVQEMVMPNYYHIKITPEGFLEGFRPQTDEEKVSGTMIATGVYMLDSSIFEHRGVEVNGGELGLPQTILAQKELYPIKVVSTAKWIPVNSFEDIEKANRMF